MVGTLMDNLSRFLSSLVIRDESLRVFVDSDEFVNEAERRRA